VKGYAKLQGRLTLLIVREARLDTMELKRDSEGNWKIEGSYCLVSDTGKVMAKQTFNGYSKSIDLNPSPNVASLLEKLARGVQQDINLILGITEESEATK
jgi:hypothetical protein